MSYSCKEGTFGTLLFSQRHLAAIRDPPFGAAPRLIIHLARGIVAWEWSAGTVGAIGAEACVLGTKDCALGTVLCPSGVFAKTSQTRRPRSWLRYPDGASWRFAGRQSTAS